MIFKTIYKILRYQENQKKNPTDVLVEFRKGGFLGLSAKSTSGRSDIGFKNPGVGTVEKDLSIALSDINNQAIKLVIKDFDLPSNVYAKTALDLF